MAVIELDYMWNRGKNNGMYGKKHSKKTKKKMSLSMKGKGHPHSLESKLKISLAHLGKKRKPFSEEWIKNMSIANTGKNNPHYGKPIIPNWGKYKGINMRSSWEIKYAKYLDKNNINWEYESKTFDLGDTTYTPDFYLPKGNVYVEIKGWMQPKALMKIKKFIKTNPDIKYLLLEEKELKARGIL